MEFANKVAIVTGAGVGGIGEGIASNLARAGARVVIGDINGTSGRATAALIEREGGEAHYLPLDISSERSAIAMAEAAVERFGRVDYLVNNAALFGGMARASLMGMDWDLLKLHFDINILGGLCVTRAVVPHMVKTGGGAIVATSSTAAWMAGGHYSVAKLAVNSLVVSLARELGPLNIRVNAIAPGMTDTQAMRGQSSPEHIQKNLEQLSIKRMGTPEDQARVVMFLLSDAASFVTGQIIAVDGGSIARP